MAGLAAFPILNRNLAGDTDEASKSESIFSLRLGDCGLRNTSVHNSEDISGIMCTVEIADGYKMACALTHLILPRTEKLYAEITDYQRKRKKRIKQLNLTGLN